MNKSSIFNTDQGSQFISEAFTSKLKAHHIQISMDGKERWVDSVFVERLWRSLKYEDVYLKAYETPRQAESEIGKTVLDGNGNLLDMTQKKEIAKILAASMPLPD